MNFDASVMQVPIEDIIPSRNKPRQFFDETLLNELAQSIKENGIIQPLVLRREGDKYEIVSGERRYRASKMAGLVLVPAVIANIDATKSAQIAVVENVQRKSISPIEEAKSYKELINENLMTLEQISQKVGIPQSAIINKIKLLNGTLDVQKALTEDRISERHARSLIKIKDPALQVQWLNKVLTERLNVRQLNEKISEELGDLEDDSIDIEFIKNMSTDVPTYKIEKKEETGPITLGIGTTISNNLEDEQANMKTYDIAENIFDFNDNTLNGQSLSTGNTTDDIEFLDLGMPSIGTESRDISIAEFAIDSTVTNLLNDGWLVDVNKNKTNKEITITLKIEDKF